MALGCTERHTSRCKDFDLLWLIFYLKKDLPIKITYEHVYGHQDDTKIRISRLEQLNCEADHGAKIFLAYCLQHNYKSPGDI